jgi:hypothetical protein
MNNLEFRVLRADEIDCRISTCSQWGVGLLLYKDARCDQNILDETVGAMNWQRHHSRDNANCIVSIWDKEKNMWIEKEDTGTESFTEAEKGLASDSFKRACFNWGIGRELYTAPNMFVFKKDLKTLEQSGNSNKWTCKDSFVVTDIQYDNRKIVYVKVLNLKTENEIEFGMPANVAKEQKKIEDSVISSAKVEVIKNRCTEYNVAEEKVCERFKIASLEEMTEKMFVSALKIFEKTEKK